MGAVIRFPVQSARPPADPYACLRAMVAQMFRSEAAAPARRGSVQLTPLAAPAGRPAAAPREEEIGLVLRRIERRLSQLERLAASGRV